MSLSRVWIVIPSELLAIRLLGSALHGVLDELQCDPAHAATTELCVVEAVTNAIEHGYRFEPGHRVEVELSIAGDRLSFTVSDQGSSWPAGAIDRARGTRTAVTERDELAEGGYGLNLILNLMEAVDYHRADDRNVLSMATTVQRRTA